MAKVRDSGMPPAEQWEDYFDAAGIVETLCGTAVMGDAVEFGCGYGTFTIPCARRISGTLHAMDIDPQMVASTSARVARHRVQNARIEQRDFVSDGCGCESESVSRALLFNILHIENPVALLKEAYRALRPGGSVAIVHWNYDADTPRGPPLDIRPRPDQCRAWAEEAGFAWGRNPPLPRSPWHWGMVMVRS